MAPGGVPCARDVIYRLAVLRLGDLFSNPLSVCTVHVRLYALCLLVRSDRVSFVSRPVSFDETCMSVCSQPDPVPNPGTAADRGPARPMVESEC